MTTDSNETPENVIRSPMEGLHLLSLPDGWTAVGALALIKCLDADGGETWSFRTTEGITDEEALGALVIRAEITKAALLEFYVGSDEGDEGEQSGGSEE